jgi:hypothetical protein
VFLSAFATGATNSQPAFANLANESTAPRLYLSESLAFMLAAAGWPKESVHVDSELLSRLPATFAQRGLLGDKAAHLSVL